LKYEPSLRAGTAPSSIQCLVGSGWPRGLGEIRQYLAEVVKAVNPPRALKGEYAGRLDFTKTSALVKGKLGR